MSETDVQSKAKELFVKTKSELLRDQLDRMEGWFHLSQGDIQLNTPVLELSAARKYLGYMLAAYVAEFIGERETAVVPHEEADAYFGWSDGRTARHHASRYDQYLRSTEEGKEVAPGQVDDLIGFLESAMDGDA